MQNSDLIDFDKKEKTFPSWQKSLIGFAAAAVMMLISGWLYRMDLRDHNALLSPARSVYVTEGHKYININVIPPEISIRNARGIITIRVSVI